MAIIGAPISFCLWYTYTQNQNEINEKEFTTLKASRIFIG